MAIIDKYPTISENTASRILDGEAVIVLPLESIVYTFDAVGTRIWELINGGKKLSSIIKDIQNEYEVLPEAVEQDTVEFILNLVSKKMLILSETPDAKQ